MQSDKTEIRVGLTVPKERCIGDSPANSCRWAGILEYGVCPIFDVECIRTDKPRVCKDAPCGEGQDG